MRLLHPGPPRSLDLDALTALYLTDRTRAHLRANFVTSLDGAVAIDGSSRPLSGPADRRLLGLLRMLCDALLVGAGTLRREDYRPLTLSEERRRWREERGLTPYPRLVVVSGRLALDPRQRALAGAPVRPLVLTGTTSGKLDTVADVVEVRDLGAAVATLQESYPLVLSEGGPQLFTALQRAGKVDELCLTLSPLLAGPGAGRIVAGEPVATPRQMALRHVVEADDGALLLRYTRI